MHRAINRINKSWNSISPDILGPCHVDQLIFLHGVKKLLIYFTVISFAVYVREQNWPPQTTPHQFLCEIWAIAYSVKNNWLERKTSPDGYKFSWWFLALSRFSLFTFSLMAWQETKKIILINSRLFTMDWFSTNAPTSRRIPTVMWKLWIPSVHCKSLNEIHYVPFNEGQVRRDGYLLFYFQSGAIQYT